MIKNRGVVGAMIKGEEKAASRRLVRKGPLLGLPRTMWLAGAGKIAKDKGKRLYNAVGCISP